MTLSKRLLLSLLLLQIFVANIIAGIDDGKKCYKDFDPEEYNQNRILGGSECYQGQWPFIVQIQIGGGNCTGSILNSRYILTAAHCLFEIGDHMHKIRPLSDFKVIVGSVKYGIGGSIHEIDEIFPHAGYNKLGDHDITLLKLKTPIVFNDLAKPICITDKYPSNPSTFKKVVAIGFGATAIQINKASPNPAESSKLEFGKSSDKNFEISRFGGICKFVDIPLKKDDHCLHLPKNFTVHFVPDLEICGGGIWKGTLEGDSGGPLIGLLQDGYYQIGLTARGQPVPEEHGNPVDFGVYTKISKYCDWISQQTKNEVVCG